MAISYLGSNIDQIGAKPRRIKNCFEINWYWSSATTCLDLCHRRACAERQIFIRFV